MNIVLLSELVNKNGSRINGDYKIDQDNSMTTSPSEPPVTTDDFIKATRQGKSMFMYRSFYTEDDENKDVKLPKKDKKKKNPKKVKSKKIKESVFTKKDFDREFVDRGSDDMDKNEIPNLESLRETNPILIRKVSALKDIVEKNNASGEELGVIINHILSMDLKEIPREYKNILKNKLK
ncbi:hypothetical protein N9966_00510 [bacterium]|nr:hypothetical protein [bacterium]